MISMYLHNPGVICDAVVDVDPLPNVTPDGAVRLADSRSEELRDLFFEALHWGESLDMRLISGPDIGLPEGSAVELWVDGRAFPKTATSLPDGEWSWDFVAWVDNTEWDDAWAPFVQVIENDDPGGKKVSVRLVAVVRDGQGAVVVARLDEYDNPASVADDVAPTLVSVTAARCAPTTQ